MCKEERHGDRETLTTTQGRRVVSRHPWNQRTRYCTLTVETLSERSDRLIISGCFTWWNVFSLCYCRSFEVPGSPTHLQSEGGHGPHRLVPDGSTVLGLPDTSCHGSPVGPDSRLPFGHSMVLPFLFRTSPRLLSSVVTPVSSLVPRRSREWTVEFSHGLGRWTDREDPEWSRDPPSRVSLGVGFLCFLRSVHSLPWKGLGWCPSLASP